MCSGHWILKLALDHYSNWDEQFWTILGLVNDVLLNIFKAEIYRTTHRLCVAIVLGGE